MKVLFQSYHDFGRMYGGGPSVVHNLAAALAEIGVEVTFHDYWKHDPKAFDVVHYFSCYDAHNWLRQAPGDPPLVVTPISWFQYSWRVRFKRKLKFVVRAIWHRTTDRRRLGDPEVFPAYWFPNSEGEGHYLTEWFGVPPDRMTTVPHGVHRRFADGSGDDFERAFGLRDFVLCVGRFEYPRKNQLALVEAMKDADVPLVFIGGPDAGHEPYYEKCRAAAGPATRFLPPLRHDDPLLRSALHACKVIVQPALLESPGLAGLEGALGGANVATTDRGSTREYYSDCAWFLTPTDRNSIREAVLAAYRAPRDGRMKARALELYTWDKIAVVQKAAYEHVLTLHGRKRAGT
jgi:acetyl esterase/lipase